MSFLVNDYFVILVLALTLLGLWFLGKDIAQREANQRVVLCAVLSLGLVSLIVKITNLLYDRPRPFESFPELLPTVDRLFYRSSDPSFPANTAAVAFTMATAVWLANRKAGALCYILATLFAFSRIYVGVHYPSDILGGAALGILITCTVFKLLPFIEPLPTLAIKLARRLYLA